MHDQPTTTMLGLADAQLSPVAAESVRRDRRARSIYVHRHDVPSCLDGRSSGFAEAASALFLFSV